MTRKASKNIALSASHVKYQFVRGTYCVILLRTKRAYNNIIQFRYNTDLITHFYGGHYAYCSGHLP